MMKALADYVSDAVYCIKGDVVELDASGTGYEVVEPREHTGEWRWGNEYTSVFRNQGDDTYWAVDWQETVGDEYWSTFQDEEEIDLYQVAPNEVTTTVTWEKV